MAKPLKKEELQDKGERIPFDDALRQILKAPPAHKTSGSRGKTNSVRRTRRK
jgi:hypothetical protein